MNKRETDKSFEELFRSKLYDFEAETSAGDWESIANCLPDSKPQRANLLQRWYWTAAASVAALLVIAGTLFFFEQPEIEPAIAEMVRELDEEAKKEFLDEAITIEEQPVTTPVLAETIPAEKEESHTLIASARLNNIPSATEPEDKEEDIITTISPVEIDEAYTPPTLHDEPDYQPETKAAEGAKEPITQPTTLLTDASTTRKKNNSVRRWNFGMGGGSLSAGAADMVNAPLMANTRDVDDMLLWENAPVLNTDDLKTNIKHKTPVSLGLAVSYSLNDRFSLQTGISYTMLTSDWETTGKYHNKTRQRLHFIGIPVSVTYKIAEWNNMRFYASTGFMPEMNVAGKLRVKGIVDKDDGQEMKRSSTTQSIHIKPVYWSVNARAGVSYPLFRYVSAFAEAGVSYYFDNSAYYWDKGHKIDVETIHSEKPFNVSLNFGLRVGL